MLTILGRSHPSGTFCDGLSRRSFLRIGALGLGAIGGANLAQVLAAQEQSPGRKVQKSVINIFLSPKEAGTLVWGAGPTILLPTITNPDLGSNRVSLGPAALLFYAKKNWNAGVVVQQGWSLGGGSGINEVNAFGAQYLFTYNLPKGWSFYSNSTITSNWTREPDDRWTVPLGGGFGKLSYIGSLPVSLSLQSFYNIVKPAGGPDWTLNIQLAFLFAAPQ